MKLRKVKSGVIENLNPEKKKEENISRKSTPFSQKKKYKFFTIKKSKELVVDVYGLFFFCKRKKDRIHQQLILYFFLS